MTSEKEAYVFLFTEWHLRQGKSNESPENWPPFCNANPPDGRPLREIVKDIHRIRDNLLPKNFPREEKMEFRPSGTGPEAIGSKAEPKWESVWGVIIDRSAVCQANEEKLTSMGVRLNKTLGRRRGYRVDLFITPRGDKETPGPLKRYEDSFIVQIVDNSNEFAIVVAGALVQSSQRPNAAVTTYMNDNY